MLENNLDTQTLEEGSESTQEISQEETNPTQTDNASIEAETIKAKGSNDTNIGKEFTAEQQVRVNELVRTRLERQKASFLKKYEVEDEKEFENLIGMQQSYQVMRDRYDAGKKELSSLKEKLAFIENNINPNRYDDIRAYFKGKGIEFNNDSLIQELATHPEWLKVIEKDTTPKTTITTLGVEHNSKNIAETEDERMARVFGLK